MNKILTLLRQPFISLKYYSKHRNYCIWVFGEWFGQKACDNPLYLANYICNNDSNIKCYWVANKDADLHLLDKKINVIIRDSRESKSLFKKCGVAIMNQGFVDLSSSANNYFNGAITINLWHGVAWKKINFDTIQSQLLRPFLHIYKKMIMANYYLSSSKECARIFKSAFLTDNIIFCGQPRNSILFSKSYSNITKEIFLKKHKLPSKTKIITYMPTFRDSHKPNFVFTDNIKLKEILVPNNYIIVQKNHFASSNAKILLDSEYIINSSNLSAQELLSISDILITDYSSCFFDFLIKNKPIIHYIYDYIEYMNYDRGLYYSVDEVKCGEICYSFDELLTCIQDIVNNNDNNSSLRTNRYNKFIEYESPNNCSIILDKIKEIINEN